MEIKFQALHAIDAILKPKSLVDFHTGADENTLAAQIDAVDLVVVPALVDASGAVNDAGACWRTTTAGEGDRNFDLERSAAVVAFPRGPQAWETYLKQELETARSQGFDPVEKGLVIVVKKNGRVLRRLTGQPPWSSLVVTRHAELRAVCDLHGSHERAPGRLAREAPQDPPVLFHDDDQAFLDRIKSLRPRRLELLLQIRLPGLSPARKRDDGRGPLEVEVPVAFVRGRRSPARAGVVHGPARVDERRDDYQVYGIDLGRQRVFVGALVSAQRARERLHVLLAPYTDGNAVAPSIFGKRPALRGRGRRRHDELR